MLANYKLHNNYIIEIRFFPLDTNKQMLEVNDTNFTLGKYGIVNGEVVDNLEQLTEEQISEYQQIVAAKEYE
jgi:hypothetical protein